MKKLVFVHGILAGLLVIGGMIVSLTLGDPEELAGGVWLGYLIMIVALSLVFLGIKRYRDQQLGGAIKFGTAVLLGVGITLVASLIYVAVWEAYLAATDHVFIEKYTASVLASKEAEGLEGPALEAEAAKLETLKERYADPLFRLPMTFIEIFPVGLFITLISAALLRNSRFLPA